MSLLLLFALFFFVPHPGALWHKGGVPLGTHAARCWTCSAVGFLPFQKRDVCTRSPLRLAELIHLCCLAFAFRACFSSSELPRLSRLAALMLSDEFWHATSRRCWIRLRSGSVLPHQSWENMLKQERDKHKLLTRAESKLLCYSVFPNLGVLGGCKTNHNGS